MAEEIVAKWEEKLNTENKTPDVLYKEVATRHVRGVSKGTP